MDDRHERARRNEALFRSINDQLEHLDEALGVATVDRLDIVCECGDGTCVAHIPIPPADYARIRSDPTLYILLSGHEDVTAEAVVEEEQSYLVVRKPGGPADLAG